MIAIPGFRLVRKLGEGGMGVVYEAEQTHPRRPVALKVIRAGLHADPFTLRMFEREMQTLARLKHPGVASIYESGVTPEGLPFYAMELVRGEVLDRHLARRGWGEGAAYRVALFRKICDAVAHAHQRGIVHRDLKPANVMVLEGPGIPAVKVLDFGLARAADPERSGTLVTEVGRVKGTLAYMSPEQVQGNSDEIDLRTDVYALGVMFYEALTGERPYDLSRVTLGEAVRVICDQPPKPMTGRGIGRLDMDVATIVGKALEKEPSRRYSNALALGEDLQRYLDDQPIQARPASATYQLRKLVVRHKLPFVFAAVIMGVLATSTVALGLQASRLAVERDQASRQAEAAGRVVQFLVSLFHVARPDASTASTVLARDLLDRGAVRIGRELRHDPAVRAELLDTMGNVYRSLGLFARAQPMLEEGLQLRKATFGPSHPEVAESHNSLAHCFLMQGRYGECGRHARKAMEILQARGRTEGLPMAWASYFLAGSDDNLGDHARAGQEFQVALRLFERHLGHDSLPVSWCLQDLGRSRALAGDVRGALTVAEDALHVQERILGPSHPDIARGLNNVGYLHFMLGELEAARPLVERAASMSEETSGPDHPVTANILESLGELRWRMGDLAGARAVLERAAAILGRHMEPASYERVLANVALARVLLDQGDLDAAGRLFEDSLALQQRYGSLGADARLLQEGYAAYRRRRAPAEMAPHRGP